jgi:hypothetical protein
MRCFIKKHGPFADVVENFQEMARRPPIDWPFGKHELHLMFFFVLSLSGNHMIMFSFWFATICWNQLCYIFHKFIMVFPKLKSKVMSNKTSRRVDNTDMENILVPSEYGMEAINHHDPISHGKSILLPSYFVFNCFKSFYFLQVCIWL